MSSYDLSRAFFDWSFENPEKVKTIHVAIYFFAIEHNNRLGWKEKFGFPSGMAMEAIGVKNYSTYITALKELVEFGFIEMVEKSKNQYSANIIMLNSAIPKNNKANSKALDKAFIKHGIKQSKSTGESNSESTAQSTMQSNDTIDKQINNITIEQTNKQTNELISNEISESKNLEVISKNQKKKKRKLRKRKKESPHQGMVSVWFEWFENEFGVEPKNDRSRWFGSEENSRVLDQIAKPKNNYSNESLYESFKIILEAIKEHEWIYQNVSLSIIESKINELIAIVRKPKQTKTQIQEASTMSALEILNRKNIESMKYENWKLEKFLRDTEKQELNESLLMTIHQYFVFRNISSDENLKANIALSIIEIIPVMPFLKLSAVKLAMERIDITQNNISPAAVIDAIRKIYKSDLMAEIINKHLENSEIKQLPVGQKSYQEKYEMAQQSLATIQRMYEKKGIIQFMPHQLFDILTTEGYFNFIKENKDQLNEVAKQRIIRSLQTELIESRSGDQLVIKKRINEVKSGIVDEQELKIERRKYILELYFKIQINERASSEAVSNV